ncbi:MAG: signal peptide peptidase SppA [Deltaproteobacteria bacterium]|nr:signal peptide peptidase SppA [Deltaproteobacteria bacterium]
MLAFRSSGKPLQVLLEYADDRSYYLASAASDLRIVRTGTLWLDGLSADVGFYGGPLALAGVQADLEQIGEYKNAADVMVRSGMTAAHRESMTSLIDGLFEELVTGIAESRGLEQERAAELISGGPYTPSGALAAGLVDAVSFPDEADDALTSLAGVARLRDLSLATYLRRAPSQDGPLVAVVHCIGTIVPGRSSQGMFSGRTMGSDTIGAAIREAWEDDGAKAIVLRVDSPGGSPLASDLIWREVERAREAGVPVIVSMADVAASGGYWIAMGADRVVAQPSTITGSIGIYGGKYVFAGMHRKLDYEVETIERGEHSSFFSTRRPFSDAERSILKAQLAETYALFLEKVATGRGLDSPEAVDAVARGRVWTGRQALEHGLVDELGGFEVALNAARELSGLEAGASVRLRSYPRAPSLTEMFFGGERAQVRQALAHSLASELQAELPEALLAVGTTAPATRLLEREHVLALMPWNADIK